MGGIFAFAALMILIIGGMWLFIDPYFRRDIVKKKTGRSAGPDTDAAVALQLDMARHTATSAHEGQDSSWQA